VAEDGMGGTLCGTAVAGYGGGAWERGGAGWGRGREWGPEQG